MPETTEKQLFWSYRAVTLSIWAEMCGKTNKTLKYLLFIK